MFRFENGMIKTPDGEDFLKYLTRWEVQASSDSRPFLSGEAVGWPSSSVEAISALDNAWMTMGSRFLVVKSHNQVILPTSGLNIVPFLSNLCVSSRPAMTRMYGAQGSRWN
jgi:hypothetical protein